MLPFSAQNRLPKLLRQINTISHIRVLSTSTDNEKLILSPTEWKKMLTHEEYQVLRNKGTEFPNTGEYNRFKPKSGYFECRGCGNPLYSYQAKFESGFV